MGFSSSLPETDSNEEKRAHNQNYLYPEEALYLTENVILNVLFRLNQTARFSFVFTRLV